MNSATLTAKGSDIINKAIEAEGPQLQTVPG